MTEPDAEAVARRIIETNLYMVLATADAEGRPWSSPVYYAPAGYRELIWVSRPGRRHSQNIAVRPEIAIVIFDSTQRIGTGHGVYMSATAEQVEGADREAAIDVFSRRSIAHGGIAWTIDMVDAPATVRLYRATAVEQFVVLGDDERRPVEL